MKKFVIAILTFMMLPVTLSGHRIVVLDSYGERACGAGIFGSDGKLRTLADDQGEAEIPEGTIFPLIVKSMGMRPTLIHGFETDTVRMEETPRKLAEVTVVADERPVARMIYDLVEHLTLINGQDTANITMNNQVEYLLPTRKIKGYKGRTNPHILSRHYEVNGKIGSGDSISNEIIEALSFAGMMGRTYWLEVPDCLRDSVCSDTIFTNKRMIRGFNRRNGNTVSLFRDGLSDKKDHHWSPWLLKLLGMTIDVYDLWRHDIYEVAPGTLDKIPVDQPLLVCQADLKGSSMSVKSHCTGKFWRKFFDTDRPTEWIHFLETYPTDVTFITVEEARALEKKK